MDRPVAVGGLHASDMQAPCGGRIIGGVAGTLHAGEIGARHVCLGRTPPTAEDVGHGTVGSVARVKLAGACMIVPEHSSDVVLAVDACKAFGNCQRITRAVADC